jgi:hypothetical protein
MTRPTLHLCPPNLRTETLRSYERRLFRAVMEIRDCADIAQQLDMVPVAVDLRETQARVEAARLAVLGCAR